MLQTIRKTLFRGGYKHASKSSKHMRYGKKYVRHQEQGQESILESGCSKNLGALKEY